MRQSRCTWQGFKVNLDGFSGVSGLLFGVCHHSCHGFTDKSNCVCGQDMTGGARQCAAIGPFEIHGAGHGFQSSGPQFLTREHPVNARHALGGLGVDGLDLSVGVGRP